MCRNHDKDGMLEKFRGGITLTPRGHSCHIRGAQHSHSGGITVTRCRHSTHTGGHMTHSKRGIAVTPRGHNTHTLSKTNQPQGPLFKAFRQMPANG